MASYLADNYMAFVLGAWLSVGGLTWAAVKWWFHTPWTFRQRAIAIVSVVVGATFLGTPTGLVSANLNLRERRLDSVRQIGAFRIDLSEKKKRTDEYWGWHPSAFVFPKRHPWPLVLNMYDWNKWILESSQVQNGIAARFSPKAVRDCLRVHLLVDKPQVAIFDLKKDRLDASVSISPEDLDALDGAILRCEEALNSELSAFNLPSF